MSDTSRLLGDLYNVFLKNHGEEVAIEKLKNIGNQLVLDNDITKKELNEFLELVEPSDINSVLEKFEKYKKTKKPKRTTTTVYSDPCSSSGTYRSYC